MRGSALPDVEERVRQRGLSTRKKSELTGASGNCHRDKPKRAAKGPFQIFPEEWSMTIRNWLRSSRSRRAIGIRAWVGLALIAGGLLFLSIHLGESARKSAERTPPTSALPVPPEQSRPSASE
jgi:hypothetical protein